MSGESSFEVNFALLARAIDDVLVANHALRAQLRPGHPPFAGGSLLDGLQRYGPESPVAALWNECRLVEALSIAWTGNGAPAFEVSFAALARAIDDLLVAHHALRAQLPRGYPPFESATLADARQLYGQDRPIAALWNECAVVEALSIAWTGRGIANAPAAAPVPPTVSAAPVDPPVTNGSGHD